MTPSPRSASRLACLWWLCALLPACAAMAREQELQEAPEPGAYLSLGFGSGRIAGEGIQGKRSMGGRALEIRAGRHQANVEGGEDGGRIDFVHYNEGHPDNNHRDGFAVQWLAVHGLGGGLAGELGIGPYLSMNTTVVDGRQIDDAHWGLLASAALRIALPPLPSGTHLRIGLNHARMPEAHRSTALLLGLGRQFGPARPDPATAPGARWWLGASVGNAITNMAGRHAAQGGVLEVRTALGERAEHWTLSGKLVFEGDDRVKVDRRGLAIQLAYVQQVTPRLSMSAGAGPYVARNRRDTADPVSGNLLVSFQAERALSHRARAFVGFNRVKTFRDTDDRDLFHLGLLLRF